VGFLVAEETVGYGPCLVVESTSTRYLNLVPLMHQIPSGSDRSLPCSSRGFISIVREMERFR
jgi:hypothetical protein